MSGTVLDDLELIIDDLRGDGGRKPPSHDREGGGDDGEGGGGRVPEPRRSGSGKHSTAIALAMVSIIMFFLVLTAAFLALRVENLHTWAGIQLPRILWLNTTVLLLSSFTLEFARRRLRANDREGFTRFWKLTTILGAAFLGGQAIAWRQLAEQGAFLTSRLASGFFYVFTALHAAHLLGGLCALLYVGLRKFDDERVSRSLAAQVTSYYWHFMDGLWLFLFALLYFGQ